MLGVARFAGHRKTYKFITSNGEASSGMTALRTWSRCAPAVTKLSTAIARSPFIQTKSTFTLRQDRNYAVARHVCYLEVETSEERKQETLRLPTGQNA